MKKLVYSLKYYSSQTQIKLLEEKEKNWAN